LLKFFAAWFLIFVITYLGVEIFRRWSLKREIFDVPNERSSHTVPTPRGGGIVICLVSLLSFAVYAIVFEARFYWSYMAGSLIIALISLLDDLKNISPFVRISLHGVAAALVIWECGALKVFMIPFYGTIDAGPFGTAYSFLWIVWLINAYNFMDGIDGLAATQAITAGIGWSLLGFFGGAPETGFFGGVLAAAAAGFLVHNWQPAKIFMGDVGSAFLGFTFAVLPLFQIDSKIAYEPGLIPWFGVLLVWFFVFDSMYTFLRRLFRGEKVWLAHREHIYQKLLKGGATHAWVAGLYGIGSAGLVLFIVLSVWTGLGFEALAVPAVLSETLFLIIIYSYKTKFVR